MKQSFIETRSGQFLPMVYLEGDFNRVYLNQWQKDKRGRASKRIIVHTRSQTSLWSRGADQ
ncbi:hypothetical protein [Neptunomonas sp.]|uniref:hypothetical protein n=1 Tax=Neptunomonas sp. TaxID=1971898 RepID=UPI0025FAFEAC|nr:hypothetical protein [Neptunomonas sp.]